MIEHYEEIRALHVGAASASGALFLLRGLAMWRGSGLGMAAPVRYLSYAIDTLLLAAAVTLAVLMHRIPFVDRWLTAKIGLVLVYIALGSFALKRAPTPAARRACLLAALLTFGAILWVALQRGSGWWVAVATP